MGSKKDITETEKKLAAIAHKYQIPEDQLRELMTLTIRLVTQQDDKK